MSQILTNELCKKCNTYNLTEEYYLDGYSKYCSNCDYSYKSFQDDENDLGATNLTPGAFVVLNEEKSHEEELECPIFKVLKITNSNDVTVIELSNEMSNDSNKEFIFNKKDVIPVKVTPLTLIKNYVINTTLDWDYDAPACESGEFICGIKTFDVIKNSNNIDDFISKINNTVKDFFNEKEESYCKSIDGFEDTKKRYAEKVKLLYSYNEEELINLYISDAVYKFTEFNLSDRHIEDAVNKARELNI